MSLMLWANVFCFRANQSVKEMLGSLPIDRAMSILENIEECRWGLVEVGFAFGVIFFGSVLALPKKLFKAFVQGKFF